MVMKVEGIVLQEETFGRERDVFSHDEGCCKTYVKDWFLRNRVYFVLME